MRKVLFVDDEVRVLQGLQRMLRPLRTEWEMTFVESGQAALEFMKDNPIDVIVSDMRMPGMDGAQLLVEVTKRHPAAVRIVLSGQAEKEAVLRAIGPSHQYLSKPCDAETLKNTISRACALQDLLHSERLSFVASLKNLPSVPKIYQEIVEELRMDEPSIPHVTRLVQQDMAMTAKVLQIINSAYFGLRRQVTSASMAINLLGLENVRSIVLFANAFSQVDLGASQGALDRIWGHSMLVGRLAQDIAKQEGLPKQTVDDALTAGLLHDCGKLVMLANLGKEYAEAAKQASQENRPTHEVETEMLGASHAEIGAYLLGIWGLPGQIVEAVAFHHSPADLAPTGLSLLGLVHVANGLVLESNGEADEARYSGIDLDFLNSSGLYAGVDGWRNLSAAQK